MEKPLFLAFVLSPAVLFALLRTPETPTPAPTPTLAAQTPCRVATRQPPGYRPSGQAVRPGELAH